MPSKFLIVLILAILQKHFAFPLHTWYRHVRSGFLLAPILAVSQLFEGVVIQAYTQDCATKTWFSWHYSLQWRGQDTEETLQLQIIQTSDVVTAWFGRNKNWKLSKVRQKTAQIESRPPNLSVQPSCNDAWLSADSCSKASPVANKHTDWQLCVPSLLIRTSYWSDVNHRSTLILGINCLQPKVDVLAMSNIVLQKVHFAMSEYIKCSQVKGLNIHLMQVYFVRKWEVTICLVFWHSNLVLIITVPYNHNIGMLE